MTLCSKCEFYKETDVKKKVGLCEIRFPVWVDRAEITSRKANIVGANEGCDLGKTKQEDEEL